MDKEMKLWQPTLEEWNSGVNCPNDVEKVIIPDGVTTIGAFAFNGCKSLTSVTIPDSVTTIGICAFRDCESLKSVTIPDGVTTIDDDVFSGCESLENINIPDGVTTIGVFAFNGCKSLTSVTIPDSVTTIGDNAFRNCESLTVTIPDSVTIIGRCAFFSNRNESQTINGHAIEDINKITENPNFYGLPYGEKLLPVIKLLDSKLPITDSLISAVNNYLHANKSVDDFLRDYPKKGTLDCELKYSAKTKEELEKSFTQQHGVVPRIINSLAAEATQYNIPVDDIVNKFNVKLTRDYKQAGIPDMVGNLLMTGMSKNDFAKAIKSPYVEEIAQLCANYFKYDDIGYLNSALWITDHSKSNRDLINSVIKNTPTLSTDRTASVDAIKAEIAKVEAYAEIHKIEQEYDGFKFEDIRCDLKKCTVELGKYRAYIMDGQDPRQVQLGYDTNCCQHLGGAGETAMMYGLVNPNAGFWVIEDKESGKILAQAECWETDDVCMTNIIPDNQLIGMLNVALENGYINKSDLIAFFENSEIQSNGNTLYFDGNISDDLWGLEFDKEGNLCNINTDESDILYHMGHDFDIAAGFNKYCNEYGLKTYLTTFGDLQTTKGGAYTSNLVFDNIEFADDRQIDQFAPIIGKWCEKCDYDNVLMGNGYNELKNSEIRQTDGVEPPKCQEYSYITSFSNVNLPKDYLDKSIIDGYENINFSDHDKVEDFKATLYDRLEDLGFIKYDSESEEYYSDSIYGGCGELGVHDFMNDLIDAIKDIDIPYTDADESCSLLKVDGKVEPYFEKAYKQELEKQQPKQEQSNATITIGDTVQISYRQTDSSRVLVIENISDKEIELKNIQCEDKLAYLVLAPKEVYELPESMKIDFSSAELESDKTILNNQILSVSIV